MGFILTPFKVALNCFRVFLFATVATDLLILWQRITWKSCFVTKVIVKSTFTKKNWTESSTEGQEFPWCRIINQFLCISKAERGQRLAELYSKPVYLPYAFAMNWTGVKYPGLFSSHIVSTSIIQACATRHVLRDKSSNVLKLLTHVVVV